MRRTGFARFRELSGRGNVIPLHRELIADCLTPVSAYLSAMAGARRSFLLESADGNETIARFSFLGRDPYRLLTASGMDLVETRGRRVIRRRGDFLEALREVFALMRPVTVAGLPRFTGGAVGWVGYEASGLFEPAAAAPRNGQGDLPDASFAFYDSLLAFDHLRHTILVIASVMTEQDGRSLRRQYDSAMARLDRLASDLGRRVRRSGLGSPRASEGFRRETVGTDGSSDRYESIVASAKKSIRAGEIFQAVLSRKFERRLTGDPFSVYRALRRINPSPYMYFVRDGETVLAGASPEMMVRVERGRVEMHPIAGTRPRGADEAEDAALEAELLADEKERAEHVMLVDLGRNDLGRVCEAGSVEVPTFMRVERFSHVMHLVSHVRGSLRAGKDAFDALRACFPAGTVSGAPKVRAMQIIRDLERESRGPYAGAVCYVDHSGDLDSCILIRTMVAKGKRATVRAGAGIVADSDPRREYQEVLSKARAVLTAIEGARSWDR